MNCINTRLTLLIALCCTLSANGYAQSSNTDDADLFQWVASFGYSFGGADVVASEYDPYDDSFYTTGLASLGAGGDIAIKNTPLSLQGMVTVNFDNAEAQQGDATIDYKTIELMSFYQQGSHRFGIGLSHHLNPSFKADVNFTNEALHFEDTTAAMAEYNYLYNKKTAIGMRLTDITYQPSNFSEADSIDGSNLSIFIKTFY